MYRHPGAGFGVPPTPGSLALICYLHSRNFPHSENGPATRRNCGGRNYGMQAGLSELQPREFFPASRRFTNPKDDYKLNPA